MVFRAEDNGRREWQKFTISNFITLALAVWRYRVIARNNALLFDIWKRQCDQTVGCFQFRGAEDVTFRRQFGTYVHRGVGLENAQKAMSHQIRSGTLHKHYNKGLDNVDTTNLTVEGGAGFTARDKDELGLHLHRVQYDEEEVCRLVEERMAWARVGKDYNEGFRKAVLAEQYGIVERVRCKSRR